MKTNQWTTTTLAAALALGGFAALETPALAGPLQDRFQGGFLERAKEKLGLTEEQSARIKDTVKAEKDAITNLMDRMHEARTGLRAAIRAENATESDVRAAAAKVAAVEADAAVLRMKLHAQIDPILTHEQREKIGRFEEYLESMRDDIVGRIQARLAE